MKKMLRALSLCAAAITVTPVLAQDKPGIVAADEVETTVTVREVDHEARTVTVLTQDGREVTIQVPPQAQNLDQVHPGSRFRVRFLESVAIGVIASDEKPAATQVDAIEMAPKGATPGGLIARVTELTAKVEEIDYAKRSVKVRGPQGNLREFTVGPEVTRFDNVKVGDLVVLRVTEAMAMQMIRE